MNKNNASRYLDRLNTNLEKTPDQLLSHREMRLVAVASQLEFSKFLTLATVESGTPWHPGIPFPQGSLARAADMLLIVAAQMDKTLSGMRDLAEPTEGRQK